MAWVTLMVLCTAPSTGAKWTSMPLGMAGGNTRSKGMLLRRHVPKCLLALACASSGVMSPMAMR